MAKEVDTSNNKKEMPRQGNRGEIISTPHLQDKQEHLTSEQSFRLTRTPLHSELRVFPCRYDMTAEEFAELFFVHWYCENGLPVDIVTDRDKLFVSQFWKALHRLTGVDLKMSTSYHPQTDGASERTNRTVIQMLRFHVERNQQGWLKALPLVRFHLMNSVNASTGFSPFQLRFGRSPRVLPPLFDRDTDALTSEFGHDGELATRVLHDIDTITMEAQDNLLLAKTYQAIHANAHRGQEIAYKVGDRVMLSTFHRRRDYMQRGDHRVAKFMVRYDGPYLVTAAHPSTSTYTLDLPSTMRIHPTFHSSLLKPFVPNDDALFPERAHPRPGPIVTEDGQEEHFVERILDHRRVGRGHQFLIRWRGFGPSDDEWLPGRDVRDLAALDKYLASRGITEDEL